MFRTDTPEKRPINRFEVGIEDLDEVDQSKVRVLTDHSDQIMQKTKTRQQDHGKGADLYKVEQIDGLASGTRQFAHLVQTRKSQRSIADDISEIELQPHNNKNEFQAKQMVSASEHYNIECEDKDRPSVFASLQSSINNAMKSDGYKYLFMLVLTAFAVSLLIYNFNPNSAIPTAGYSSNAVAASFYIELFCQIFFVFHITLTIINYENIEYQWLALDISTTLIGIIALFMPGETFDLTTGATINARNFLKAFRVLKLVFFVKLSSTINVSANNMVNSLKSVGKILIPALCFIYMYAIVGLYSFSDYEYNRCRPANTQLLSSNWPVYEEEVFLCGARECPSSYSCLNPIDFGVSPSRNQLLRIELGNGLMTYENIFYALLSTLKEIFGTGCSRLIILQKQAINYIYVEVYYLSFIYLLSYVYLNIFYGLMMSNEEDVQEDPEANNRLTLPDNLDADDMHQAMNRTNNGNGFRDTSTSKFGKTNTKFRTSNNFTARNSQKSSNDQGPKPKNVFDNESVIQEESDEEYTKKNIEPVKSEAKLPKKTPSDNSEHEQQKVEEPVDEVRSSAYGIINMGILNRKDDQESVPDEMQIVQEMSPNMLIQLPDKDKFLEQKQSQTLTESSKSEVQSEEADLCNWDCLHEIYVYFNHSIIILGCINLALDFKDQSDQFKFVVDTIDFGFYILFFIYCILELVFHALRMRMYKEDQLMRNSQNQSRVQEENMSNQDEQDSDDDHNQSAIKIYKLAKKEPTIVRKIMEASQCSVHKPSRFMSENRSSFMEEAEKMEALPLPEIPRTVLLEILLLILCSVGVIYEGMTATSPYSFLKAENETAKIFRCFKYLRIIVLLISRRYFSDMRVIVISIFATVYKIWNFILFWMLTVLIFTLIGFHLFAYRTRVDTNSNLDLTSGTGYPISFDSVYKSLVFTMFTFYNQQWDVLMFQQFLGSGLMIIIWQIFSIFIGLVIMSKYFMALLMKELGEELDRIQEDSLTESGRQERRRSSKKLSQKINGNLDPNEESIHTNQNSVYPVDAVKESRLSIHDDSKLKNSVSFHVNQLAAEAVSQSPQGRARRGSVFDAPIGPPKPNPGHRSSAMQIAIDFNKFDITPTNGNNQEVVESNSQQIQDSCGANLMNRVVRLFRTILEHRFSRYLRTFVILMSITDLIVRHPQTDPTSVSYTVMYLFDTIVKIFFLMELIVELTVYGLFGEKTSYLRKSWVNWFNLIIIIIEILNYLTIGQFQVLSKIQIIKVLRVLYFIEMRYDVDRNMRLTVVGFQRLVPKVLTMLAVTIVMYGYFALLLLKLYKNNYWYCDGVDLTTSKMTIASAGSTIQVDIDTRNDCLLWGGNWIEYQLNASNFLSSLLYCFLSATTEGWTSLSIPASSFRGVNLQPVKDSNPLVNIFFMAFFFFGNMIMLNVFVGLTMNNFNKIKQEVTGEAKLTKVEKEWLSIKKLIYRLEPELLNKPPEHPVRNIVYHVVKSPPYAMTKAVLVMGFVVSMSLFTTNMSNAYFNALVIVKFLFVGLEFVFFTMELIAVGVRSGNLLKVVFKCVLLTYALVYGVVLLMVELSKQNKKVYGGILIALLLIDYFQAVLMEFQFVKKLLNSLISVLPQTTNLIIIIVCTLFIYTVVGMELFSYLKTNTELNSYDQNYRNFERSLWSLVKFSLMENPIDQLSDAAEEFGPNFVCYQLISYSDFQQYGQMGCGNKVESYLFFLSFHVIYSLILMSTLIAIIFDAYSEVRREEEAMVNKFQLQQVKEEWKTYDMEATGYISYRDFWMFTAKLVKIYEIDKEQIMSSETKQSFLQSLSIPIYEHGSGILCFQFHQVIEALTRVVFMRKHDASETNNADKMFTEQAQNNIQKLKRSYYDSSHVLTLIILKSGLRIWRKKSKMSDQESSSTPLFATYKIKEMIDKEKEQANKRKEQQEEQERKEENMRLNKGRRRKANQIFQDKPAEDDQVSDGWADKLEEELDNKKAVFRSSQADQE